MCGRYTLSQPGEILEQLEVINREPLAARYNVAPTQNAPTVRAGRAGRELAQLRWGLVPGWAQDAAIGNKMINARGETAAEKPSFKSALKKRRCLVLTDGFYEWKKLGSAKQPYHIRFPDRRPFVFAGLWERWTRGPEPLETFTILTIDANDTLRELHHRMPVIFGPEQIAPWLDPTVEDLGLLSSLLKPWAGDPLELVPVSRLVNSPSNDRPEVLEPVSV